MLKKMASIIILTFKEGVRDRALIGICIFSFLMMATSFIVVGLFMRELHKVTVDINISAITLAGLMLTFFISINLMAKDMDKHTIYCVLSKPFSRSQYVWGKYLGIMLIIFSAFCILTLCSTLTVMIIKSQFETWFVGFKWLSFFKAVYAEFLMFFMLNAIVIFFSSITTSSFITLLFSLSTYVAGQTIEEVVIFIKANQLGESSIDTGIETLINICQYILPNFSVFDIKIRAAHSLTISMSYLLNITVYSFIYSFILLVFSSMIMNRRELV